MEKDSFSKGRQEGRQEGREEGRQEERESIVIEMLKAGKLALDEIAAYTHLKLSQVQELAKTLA